MPENNGTYTKVRKLLFNEISLIISVIAVIFGMYFFLTTPQIDNKTDINNIRNDINLIQKDINVITTNHLAHIQTGLEKECERNDAQDKLLNLIGNDITRILTILEK